MSGQRPPAASALRQSARDPSRFSAFYGTHARDLVVFFTRRTYDAEVALDLTAETFAQAFARRRRFRGSSEAEETAWLYAIARRQLARYIRRGKAERKALRRLGVEPPALSPEEQLRIEELAGLAELRAAVADELRALSLQQRQALQLKVVDELAYPEVAARLQISEQAARARVSRGLRSLAAALERLLASERGAP